MSWILRLNETYIWNTEHTVCHIVTAQLRVNIFIYNKEKLIVLATCEK